MSGCINEIIMEDIIIINSTSKNSGGAIASQNNNKINLTNLLATDLFAGVNAGFLLCSYGN